MTGKYGDTEDIKKKSGIKYTDLDLSDSATLDTFIDTLNEEISESVESYCQRDFESHDVTETYDGNGIDSISLRGYPVQSISTVKIGDNTLDSDNYRVRDNPNYSEENAGIIERKNTTFPYGWDNVEIDYTYGYTSTPTTIKSISEDMIVDALLEYEKNVKVGGSTNMSLEGYSADFDFEDVLNEDRKVRLEPYTRWMTV